MESMKSLKLYFEVHCSKLGDVSDIQGKGKAEIKNDSAFWLMVTFSTHSYPSFDLCGISHLWIFVPTLLMAN